LTSLALACATSPDFARYRLSGGGLEWKVVGDDHVLDEVRALYPDFFSHVFDSEKAEDFDLRPLREDLEHEPVDKRNYDALNAVAIAYFEINARAEANRGQFGYLGDSFRTAKLAGVPWSAYGRVEDGDLRDAILDFFEDIATGEKLGSGTTASRLIGTVASLEKKESDGKRLERINDIVDALKTLAATATR
jgi:hypothetical protein